jgi:predicted transcriptional regulator
MKRTTIFVPEALERDLQLYARREGKATAAVVREALAAYIASKRPGTELPSFAGAFDSGRSDTAERHEEILFRRLTPHGEKPRRRAAKRRR